MISNRKVVLFVLLTASLALFSIKASAQQGWSRAQVVKQQGKDASVNAVFYNGDEVWIVGADGLLARSYDDGRTFQSMDLGIAASLNDVFARNEDMWVVGDEGTILVSTDGGRSFVKRLYRPQQGGSADPQSRAGVDLYSVQFIDSETGFIVGDNGLILVSDDGGYSWREQRSGSTAQLFHLSFLGRRGWVVGTGGVILHTNDGGRNWYPQQSGTSDDLNRVQMITDRIGIITGDNGALLRTDNGGATWGRINLRFNDPLFGISFIDKKTGWVVGHSGHIIRTYDGGRNWVEQESGTTADLFAVSFARNQGYAIGRDGLVMRYYERR